MRKFHSCIPSEILASLLNLDLDLELVAFLIKTYFKNVLLLKSTFLTTWYICPNLS